MKWIMIIAMILIAEQSCALTIYPNSNFSGTLDEIDLIIGYNISGNLSNIDVETSNTSYKIFIPSDYVPSNFTLVFYGYKSESPQTIIQTLSYGSGGGGGGIVYRPINNTVQSNNSIIKEIIKEVPIEKIKEIINTEYKTPSRAYLLIGILISMTLISLFYIYKLKGGINTE